MKFIKNLIRTVNWLSKQLNIILTLLFFDTSCNTAVINCDNIFLIEPVRLTYVPFAL